ncbi:hypothetical protein FRX31_028876 [Thalictrum thalictroides]|uniref:Uncharacterized protein n=1 Tax=Thalictrum thalictroides TaxID=46969 RepID=A0A7J6VBF9_THATH|nr:hypothetical protein FRX31_028876 [Thalictrum thalictroides]
MRQISSAMPRVCRSGHATSSVFTSVTCKISLAELTCPSRDCHTCREIGQDRNKWLADSACLSQRTQLFDATIPRSSNLSLVRILSHTHVQKKYLTFRGILASQTAL